jgi:hypothetical protein
VGLIPDRWCQRAEIRSTVAPCRGRETSRAYPGGFPSWLPCEGPGLPTLSKAEPYFFVRLAARAFGADVVPAVTVAVLSCLANGNPVRGFSTTV